MGLELKVEATKFKNLMKAAGKLLDEIPIRVSQEGLEISGMDVSRTLFFYYRNENLKTDDEININISSKDIQTALKNVGDQMEIVFDDGKLRIIHTTHSSSRVFGINTLAGTNWSNKPKLDLPAEVELETKDFIKLVEDATSASTDFVLKVEDGNVEVSSVENSDISFRGMLTAVGNGSANSRFRKDYMDKILEILKIYDGRFKLKLGDKKPLIANIQLGEGEYIELILAPVII
jgi:predicted DNA binding CopG/RHH family protein